MRIVISGDPIAKARHRLTTIGGYARQYDPQEKLKKSFALILRKSIENLWEPKELALKVDLIFEMDAFIGSSKAQSNLKEWQCSYPLKKDLDNMAKFVLDCGNQILWPDDRYITELSCKKRYSNSPCTIIEINPIPEMQMTKEQETVYKTFSPEDLERIIADASQILQLMPLRNLSSDEYIEQQMAATADLLIRFADKWADKLKKIKGK